MPTRLRTAHVLVAQLVVVLILSGCAPGQPVGQATPTRSATATPDCRPTPAPPAATEKPSGRIAFAAGDDFDIWVINADGSGLRQLTTNPGPEFDPSWSPDGTRIAYRDSRRGINRDDEIYVMRADGSGQTNLTRDPGDDWGPLGRRTARGSPSPRRATACPISMSCMPTALGSPS